MKKKLLKYIIWTAAVVLALVIALVVVDSISNDTKTTVKVFINKEATDIETVTVTNSYGSYLVYSQDDGYMIDDMPSNIIDEEGFYELMYHSCAFGSLREIEKDAKDLALYGLENPAAHVEVEFTNGQTFSLTLGDKEKVSGNYYGMVNDDKSVYLFAEEDVLYFLVPKTTYISMQVTPPLAVSSPLTALKDVTFSGTALEKPIHIEAVEKSNPQAVLDAVSFGPATHIVRLNGTYELDQTYGVEVLGSILNLKATDVVGYNLTSEDYSKLGFDNPFMQVDFSLKNGTDYIADYQLKIVAYGEKYLAAMKDAGVVFLIDPPAFASIDYTKLCLRWFLSPLRADVKNLIVEFDGQQYEYTSGKTDDGIWAKVNGKTMDSEAFLGLYRLVTSASADGKYLENTSNAGAPLMTITYKYNDESKPDDVMKLYSGSTRRVNVEINGVTEFDMRETFVDAMKNACRNSLTGGPIEENW